MLSGSDQAGVETERRFDPWHPELDYRGGGEGYTALLAEFRRFTDAFVESAPSEADLRELAYGLAVLRSVLKRSPAEPGHGHSGRRHDLPGRGHPLLVPVKILRWTTNEVLGTVCFSAAHTGGRGAVHGGFPPLLFDEILGALSNTNRTEACRTAYLRTDYRNVIRPGIDYVLQATVDEEIGRKRFLSARLSDESGAVVCEASGLFVVLREGQP